MAPARSNSSRLTAPAGFTLIELLIVILIIGVLIAVSASSFLGQTGKAHNSASEQKLVTAYKAAKADSVGNNPQGAWSTGSALATAIENTEPSLGTVAVGSDPGNGSIAVMGSSDANNLALQTTSASGDICTLTSPANGTMSMACAPPPVNAGLPTISGTLQVGSTLTASNGTWLHSPTSYAYQWQRCDSSGASCADISGATSSTYTLVASDEDETVQVGVTATNASGSTSATSAISGFIYPNLSPPGTQSLSSAAWNYSLFDGATGSSCDLALSNSVSLTVPVYVVGNLCLNNSAQILQAAGTVYVKGNVTQSSSKYNSIGTTSAPLANVAVGGTCQAGANALQNPCTFNSSTTNIWGTNTSNSPPTLTKPTASAPSTAAPGPNHPCTTSSGTPPTFTSGATQSLTPLSSYTCQVKNASGQIVGELSWNVSSKVLTVSGTVYIDHAISFDNGATDTYSGQGVIYTSGTVLVKNTELCAVVSSGTCNTGFGAWNTNSTYLALVSTASATAITLNASIFQGGLYASNNISIGTTSIFQGNMIGNVSAISGGGGLVAGATLSTVPAGLPGQP